jgi:predicted PurR-regulated permease PerM
MTSGNGPSVKGEAISDISASVASRRPVSGGRLEVYVPITTILKLLFTAWFVWCLLRVWPEVTFVLVSLLFATALHPTVQWLLSKKVPKSLAVLLVGLSLFGVLGAFVVFVVPPLASQIADLAGNLPLLHARAVERLPPSSHTVRQLIDMIFKLPSSPDVVESVSRPMMWGRATVSGAASVLLVSVTTLYLLADGRRVFAWLLAYVPRPYRLRVGLTVEGMSAVIHAYVRGQLIVSVLFGTFAGVVLAILHVPNPLPLAIVAAVCDVIPLAGILLALVPAALIAFVVSPATALTVVILFLVYHWTEAYWIGPRTFGATLRLPTLAVVIGLIVGYALMGILGAVLVLPLMAAYPIIEKEWLKNYLAPEVLADHRALSRTDAAGVDRAIDAVLRGDRPSVTLGPLPPPPA